MRTPLLLFILLAACGGPAANTDGHTDDTQASSGSEGPSEAGNTAAEVISQDDALPATIAPAQGDPAFGVYLTRVDDPAEATAWMGRLRERGVENVGSGELSCDRGSADTLSLPEETIVVSVAFATREDAVRFVEGWGEPVLGIAEFVAYCRD